jgi:hypothetical protein
MMSSHITEQCSGYSEDNVYQLYACLLWPLTSSAADEWQLSCGHPAVSSAESESLASRQCSRDVINLRPITHTVLVVQHRKKETKFPRDVLGLIKVLSDAASIPDEVIKCFN